MAEWESKDVKELRKRLGMTQKQFAEAIGVHVVTIIRWEKGSFNPSGLALEKIEQLAK
jgi:putative transcriptional regulator